MIRTHQTDPHCRGVFDVPSAREVRDVMWIDIESAQYAVIDHPARVVFERIVTRTIQARKIIYVDAAMVFLIDPVDDEAPAELLTRIGTPERYAA